MKFGVISLVIGILLLIVCIPYSIYNIVLAVTQMSNNIVSGGFGAWLGVIGVVLGFVLTTIGAVNISVGKHRR